MMVKSKKNSSDILPQGGVIDKERVARSFAASISTYETSATVQTLLADTVVRQVVSRVDSFSRGLEIGCGTGYLSKTLAEQVPFDIFYLNDLSPELCSHSSGRLKDLCRTEVLAGDIEALALPTELDLVVSSSAFQWLEDLEGLFSKVAVTLNEGGLFAFSLFGRGTMAEIGTLSGKGLRYNDFSAVFRLLEKYFEVEDGQQFEQTLFFPSVLAIFRHIRNTGAGGVEQTRWTRATMKSFEMRYQQQFGTEKGLPVSYCAYSFMATRKKGGL